MMSAQSTHPYGVYLSNFRSLKQRATNISEIAQAALQQTDERYYDQMKALVLRPWRFVKEFGLASVDPNLRWPVDRNKANTDSLAENVSDRCLGELMGVGVKPLKCSISSECIRLMTQLGRTGYHLTHQLLYGMLAEQYGCLPVLNMRLRPAHTSIEQLRELFCTNNFYEVSETVAKTNARIPPPVQDIFMEQEFVCPTLGYKEFLHADWLVQILSWQKPVGCWGTVMNTGRLADNKQDEDEETEQQLQQQQHIPVNSDNRSVNVALKPPEFRTRHLLYEKVLSDGCFAHKTAVALAALTQYLRFLVSSTSAADHHLLNINYLVEPYRLPQKVSVPTTQSVHVERRPIHVGNISKHAENQQLLARTKGSKSAANNVRPDYADDGEIDLAEEKKVLSEKNIAPKEDKSKLEFLRGGGKSQQDGDYDENTEVELDKDDVKLVQSRDETQVEDLDKQNVIITDVIAHPALRAAAGQKYSSHSDGGGGTVRVMFKSRLFLAVVAIFILVFWFRCLRCFRYVFLLRRIRLPNVRLLIALILLL